MLSGTNEGTRFRYVISKYNIKVYLLKLEITVNIKSRIAALIQYLYGVIMQNM